MLKIWAKAAQLEEKNSGDESRVQKII